MDRWILPLTSATDHLSDFFQEPAAVSWGDKNTPFVRVSLSTLIRSHSSYVLTSVKIDDYLFYVFPILYNVLLLIVFVTVLNDV